MDQISVIKKQIQNILDEKDKISKSQSNDHDYLNKLNTDQINLTQTLQKLLYKYINQDANNQDANNQDANNQVNRIEDSLLDEFLKNDLQDIPAFLFFHDSVIKDYGLCPYIIDNQIKRSDWLKQQKDNGVKYFRLYEKIINNQELNKYMNEKLDIEKEIEHIINIHISDEQNQLLNEAMSLIYEYKQSKLKTKKIKEKFNKVIFLFSKLYDLTRIDIHEYINKKSNVNIIINYPNNDIKIVKKISKISFKTEKDDNILTPDQLNKHFHIYLDKYIIVLNNITISQKYIKNTKKHLYNSLNSYLIQKQKPVIPVYVQDGKYFKKWSLLTNDEKNDRFLSYVKYYISKNCNTTSVTTQEKLNDILYKLITDSYYNIKNLKYKDIKWNINSGIIDKIPLNINQSFLNSFDNNNSNENNSNENNSNEEDTSSKIFTFNIKEVEVIKKSPLSTSDKKTLFTKTNEEKINEFILTFLIKNKNEDLLNNKFKELCIDNIKQLISVKVISKSDKILLIKKYTDIYEIINKSSKQ